MIRTALIIVLQVFLLTVSLSAVYGQQLSGTPGDSKFQPGARGESGSGGGLYNPNPYTGICDINIPVYSYGTDHGDFGVSFSYNTKGVRVDELASDIGLHWTINTGATVTRIVKDLPDEMNIEADTFEVSSPSGYSNVKMNKYWRMKGKYAVYTESASSAADNLIYRDKECDDFIISLPSGTYTFNFGRNGNNFVHPAKGIRVETVFNGSVMTNINSINATASQNTNYMDLVVTDVTGCKYYFIRSGYSPKAITDIYGYGTNLADYWLTTQWVLQKAVLLNGTEISYTYNEFSSGSVFSGYSHSVVERGGGTILTPVETPMPGEVVRELKPASIKYPNNVVLDFIYDTGNRIDYPWKALREIKISSDASCTRYRLDQAYFFSELVSGSYELPYGHTAVITDKDKKARLKLKGISLLSCDGTVEEPLYIFDYNTETQLPIRGSLSQDFMGYFNGINNEATAYETGVPKHKDFSAGLTTYGSDRSQVFTKMKAGILTRITSGYGGTTEFFYGAHSGMDGSVLPLPSDAYFFGKNVFDGFRVDSIVEKDPWHPDNSKVTYFQYSNGQVFMNGGYFHYKNQEKNADGTELERIYSGSFVSPHQFVQGSNQGYSNVTVITRTGAGQQVSRRVMTFTNLKDASSGMQPRYFYTGGGRHFYQFPYTDKRYLKDWEMGLLLAATDYDENNRIVSDVTNTYRFTLDTSSATGNVENTRSAPVRLDIMSGQHIVLKENTDYYRPYTGFALLDRTASRKYVSDTRSVADTVWYTYDARNNLKSTITRNSEAQKIKNVTVFNYDVNAPIVSTLYNMTQAGLEKVVGSQRWLLGATFSADVLLDGFINTYTYIGGKLLPKGAYTLQVNQPVSYGAYTGWTSGGPLAYPDNNIHTAFTGTVPDYYRESSRVLATDAKGNILESQAGGQSTYVAMLWDTISGQKIAEAANCRYTDIAHTSFENNLLGPGGALTVTHGNIFYFVNQVINSSVSVKSVTGGKLYRLTATSAQYISSTQNLQAGREYILTFWARGATPRVFTDSNPSTALPQAVTYTATDGWKQYQVRFTPAAAEGIKIYGPATPVTMYFDEVRLFPADAVMSSWTYTPLFGPASSTDATGRITYYEYDKMGRQSVILNQERHVLSKTQYTINGAE